MKSQDSVELASGTQPRPKCRSAGCEKESRIKGMCVSCYEHERYRQTHPHAVRRVPLAIPPELPPVDFDVLPINQIKRLRLEGNSYRSIVGILEISIHEVRTVCREYGWVII